MEEIKALENDGLMVIERAPLESVIKGPGYPVIKEDGSEPQAFKRVSLETMTEDMVQRFEEHEHKPPEYATGRMIDGDQKIVTEEEYKQLSDDCCSPRESAMIKLMMQSGHYKIAVAEAAHYYIREGGEENWENAIALLRYMIEVVGVSTGRAK
jgi:hypothetical protein